MALREIARTPTRTITDTVPCDRNGLERLDTRTSLSLLTGTTVGRIAYVEGATARVVPVNVAVDHGKVWLRVGTGGLLAAITDRRLLTLEADQFDPNGPGWWSVIVTGQAHEVTRIPGRSVSDVCSWVRCDEARLVCLTPLEISGRRLRTPVLGDWPQGESGPRPDVWPNTSP